MANRPLELGTVELLAFPILFEDREVAQLDALERREPRAARLALSAPTNGRCILAWPAVLNLAVFVRAERAAHP